MTIGGWIAYGVIAAIIGVFGLLAACLVENAIGRIAVVLVAVAAVVLLLVGMKWFYKNTERGKRAFKTQESNLDGGLERVVKVYDMNGELIVEYEGKFDVTHDSNRLLFDDENGKRHTVYYSTGTVTIDEK